MLVHTTIANDFPLLAAIAHELGDADGGNEVAQLRTAGRLLRDAFRSFDHPPGHHGCSSLDKRRRRCSGAQGRKVMNDARWKAKTPAVQR